MTDLHAIVEQFRSKGIPLASKNALNQLLGKNYEQFGCVYDFSTRKIKEYQ